MKKYCSTVINATPRWSKGKTVLTITASYTLPDDDIYVVVFKCDVKKKKETFVSFDGNAERFIYWIVIPGKGWLRERHLYTRPNNLMMELMLQYVVLPGMRRNILKILRKRYEPLGHYIPPFRDFVVKLDSYSVYLDKDGRLSLVP